MWGGLGGEGGADHGGDAGAEVMGSSHHLSLSSLWVGGWVGLSVGETQVSVYCVGGWGGRMVGWVGGFGRERRDDAGAAVAWEWGYDDAAGVVVVGVGVGGGLCGDGEWWWWWWCMMAWKKARFGEALQADAFTQQCTCPPTHTDRHGVREAGPNNNNEPLLQGPVPQRLQLEKH